MTEAAPAVGLTVKLTQDWNRQALARAVTGSYFDRGAGWWLLVDPTPRQAAVALRCFPELSLEYPALATLRDTLLADARPFDAATPYGKRIAAPCVREDGGTVLAPNVGQALSSDSKWWFDFQNIDLGYLVDRLKADGGAYIGWERGLGKTLGAATLIDALDAKRVLVVAPNTAKDAVWRQQLNEFLPGRLVKVLPNVKAKREQLLSILPGQKGWQVHSDRGTLPHPQLMPFVLIVHYEALAILEAEGWWKRLGEWDLIVADEAHRIKNTKAKMTKALKKIPAKHKLALSGSIVMNHAEELFSPLQWLFPDRYKAKWRDWNDRYLEYVDSGFGKVCVGLKEGREDAMRQELGGFMAYRRKSDELDLPPKTEQTLLVDLSPKQRRAYNEVRDQFWTVLDDGQVIKTDNVLAQLTALRQIATGLDLEGGTVTDSTKLDLALEMIRDNEDEAFVVFSWFKANARAAAAALGDEAYLVTGDVPHQKRADMIAAFQAGERRVFVGTLATLSESVNLQRASNAVFLDRHWTPATNIQAADRIYRIGQTRPVTITHLVARDTVDELRVLPALASKEALRRSIFGGE